MMVSISYKSADLLRHFLPTRYEVLNKEAMEAVLEFLQALVAEKERIERIEPASEADQ